MCVSQLGIIAREIVENNDGTIHYSCIVIELYVLQFVLDPY